MWSVLPIFFAVLGVACAQLANVNNGVGDFMVRFLQATYANGKNTIYSPYSIESALAMCLIGAHGPTFTSMRDAMGFDGMSDEDIQTGFQQSSDQLALVESNSKNGFIVSKANRVLAASTNMIAAKYNTTLHDVFRADAMRVDFITDGDEIQKDVNDFVSTRTHGLIPKILTTPLDSSTMMVIVNALYFKGSWRKAMGESSSRDKFNAHKCPSQPLATASALGQTAKWIRTRDRFSFVKSSKLQATLVEVPYAPNANSKDQASMLFLLPNEPFKCDISAWIKKLKWTSVVEALKSAKPRYVNLTLPRFEIEAEFHLAGVLSSMGMQDAFSPGANFTGMFDFSSGDVSISDVIHKAKIQVDDKGTTAAAATVVIMSRSATGSIDRVEQLLLNRSFAAIIILRQSDSIVPLFASVVSKL